MGNVAGKSSRQWRKRASAGEDLAPEARGVAKAKKEVAPSGEAASKKKGIIGKSIEKLKKKKEQVRRSNVQNEAWRPPSPARIRHGMVELCEHSREHERGQEGCVHECHQVCEQAQRAR